MSGFTRKSKASEDKESSEHKDSGIEENRGGRIYATGDQLVASEVVNKMETKKEGKEVKNVFKEFKAEQMMKVKEGDKDRVVHDFTVVNYRGQSTEIPSSSKKVIMGFPKMNHRKKYDERTALVESTKKGYGTTMPQEIYSEKHYYIRNSTSVNDNTKFNENYHGKRSPVSPFRFENNGSLQGPKEWRFNRTTVPCNAHNRPGYSNREPSDANISDGGNHSQPEQNDTPTRIQGNHRRSFNKKGRQNSTQYGRIFRNRIRRADTTPKLSPPRGVSSFFSRYPTSRRSNLSGSISQNSGTSPRSGSLEASELKDVKKKVPSLKFPIIYVTSDAEIVALLDNGMNIEIGVDGAFRVVCFDKFAATINGDGRQSCLVHENARILQFERSVYCTFGPAHEKLAGFWGDEIYFTMSNIVETYCMAKGMPTMPTLSDISASIVANVKRDITLNTFYGGCHVGVYNRELCNKIVEEARYNVTDDRSTVITIAGLLIKVEENGNLEINCRPKRLECSPNDGTIRIRTQLSDMAVQEEGKAYVKLGAMRVHVSRCGMVVSDGSRTAAMDQSGKMLSSN